MAITKRTLKRVLAEFEKSPSFHANAKWMRQILDLAEERDSAALAKAVAEILQNKIETVEAIRKRFIPERITTLFVGESAPHSGDFFYCGNSTMLSHMKRAVELAFGKSDDFLKSFTLAGQKGCPCSKFQKARKA